MTAGAGTGAQARASVPVPAAKRRTWFADLHIHVGRDAAGTWVKVSASPRLTLTGILCGAAGKGLSMLGVVDCASPGVRRDLQAMLLRGTLEPAPGGGLAFLGERGLSGEDARPWVDQVRPVVLVPAVEVEVRAGRAACHLVGYFRDFQSVADYADEYCARVKNPQLSTQSAGESLPAAVASLRSRNALVCVAHAFTPHKGFYGACAARLADEVGPLSASGGLLWDAGVSCVELGLSADTDMADRIGELRNLGFLSNSDSHSLGHVAREHNELEGPEPSFDALAGALRAAAAGAPTLTSLRATGGQGSSAAKVPGAARLVANYGLDPRLGKYHRSYCNRCLANIDAPPPAHSCPRCGAAGGSVVTGVLDRVAEIADTSEPIHPPGRPPYRYQVPLEFIPGVGSRTRQRLIAAFGSEMAVLHGARESDVASEVGPAVARMIALAREGGLDISAGGGGVYGRVVGPRRRGA